MAPSLKLLFLWQSVLTLSFARQASITQVKCPQSHGAKPNFPSLDLHWISIDSFNGAYFVDIQVGEPPQTLRVVHDSGSGDIFLHSTADNGYEESCAAQTPNDICFPEYVNKTSRTYKEIGPGKFHPPIVGLPNATGSYITDTLRFPGATIRNQVIGSTWFAPLPVSLLGTSFPSVQAGVYKGTFPAYPTFIERMVSGGIIQSQTESIWLDPTRSDPDVFPDGHALYGAVDTSLFTGKLVTVPAVAPKNTTPTDTPLNWNVPVRSIAKRDRKNKNLVATLTGLSCVVDTGTSFLALPNSSFMNLVAAYPKAVYNDSVAGFPGFWQLPCSERDKASNALEVTFFDPRDEKTQVTIEVPPWQVIWPTHNLVPGGDKNTCVLNAVSWEAYFGGDGNVGDVFECVLGDSIMKAGYFVLDTGNKEASIAFAAVRRGPPRLVGIPKGGVRKLKL
ncbi:aspartic peptidase domain-containing protein [Podospora didyma]|uniref:Aspartic peptidase domain-containing protein n=1 Tax=Podospora didyma TaxID=330526 RepID=A0AAE0NZ94_9PEZI|nr:aspartic peptidase domain-containing protein [Podospora didyma]